MIYYTIYKTINNINKKYYIGKHQTENLNDFYFGSGIAIENAIKKYGRQNFEKEILFIFNTEEEMNEKEKELVTEQVVKDENTYNLMIGGKGGITWQNDPERYDIIKEKIRKAGLGKTNAKGKRSIKAIENIKKGIYEKNSGKFLIIYFNGNKEEIFNLRIYSENNNIPYATLRASAFNGKNIPKYNISKIKRLGKK